MQTLRKLVPIIWLGAALCIAPTVNARDGAVMKHKDGVTVRFADGTLRLQVYADDVIRVRFTSPKSRADVPVPVIVGRPKPTAWKIRILPAEVRLQTAKVTAEVDRRTGAVRFLDAGGSLVLSELPTRRLLPNTVAGIQTLRCTGCFALAPGEAIYGLGQHRQGLMNYRGSSVKLLQQNMEIAIPMAVSSRGYGLFWNNPAVTDVNVAGSSERVVPASMLFDDSGAPGGLTARYYEGRNFEKLAKTRRDTQIDFDWSKTAPKGLGHDDYSVRWSGYLAVPKTGDYTLTASGDDGVRLRIDGKVVAEDWTVHPLTTVRAKVHLVTGRRYKLGFDFFQAGGESVARFGILVPTKEQAFKWSSEAGNGVDYVFFYGPNLERVIASYRALTGRAPMFGRWAWGLWQSRERYSSQEELVGIAARYRQERIPLDGIIQDWQYWVPNQWGSHSFDASRYPDPAAMITALHRMDVHVLISVWAKFDAWTDNAKELVAAGGMLERVYPPRTPQGNVRYYDPFGPVGRRVYWNQVARLLGKYDLDGWWLDASEPELNGAWGEFRNYRTAMGSGALVFNAFPLMHTANVYRGQRALDPAKRSFILTRSAYAGQQRNGAVSWSGDIGADWSTLKEQVPAGLNFCLSGIPYWNTDTGAFFAYAPVTDPDYQDLFTRWFQFSAFVPMLRIHGTGTAKEIWRWPEPTRTTLIEADRLRYHLLPYIYSASWLVTSKGSTMMRALVLDFREDPRVREIGDEYMFGPDLLVAPVTTPKASVRSVYLPRGTCWVDFWTGRSLAGGRAVKADALGKLPIFARAGAVLPYGPTVQSAEDSEDPTEIRVYPGADGATILYNDEGDGYAYEHGAYATIRLLWNDRARKLTIGPRVGRYRGMPRRRTFRIVVVRPGKGCGVPSAPVVDRVVEYMGARVVVRL